MRTAILLSCLALAVAGCGAPAAARDVAPTRLPAAAAAIAPREAELRLDVAELRCHSCAGQIAEATALIPGVLHVSAAIVDRLLVVRYDPLRLSEAALIAAIDRVVDRVAQ